LLTASASEFFDVALLIGRLAGIGALSQVSFAI
jgi:hypothetical protein